MKVELIEATNQHNPDFDRTKPVTKDNHPLVDLPIGTQIEHADSYKLCLGPTAIAKPIDDEALAKCKEVDPDFGSVQPAKITLPTSEPDEDSAGDKKAEKPLVRTPRSKDPTT